MKKPTLEQTAKEVYDVINEFVKSSHKEYNSYAHATGYLTVTLEQVLMRLPKKERELVLYNLRRNTKKDNV